MTRSMAARLCAVLVAALGTAAGFGAVAWGAQPRDWELGMQTPATPVDQQLQRFHDELLVIIFAISVFVLGLLIYVMVRFHHTRNPVPTRTSHNTTVEVLWTIVPVLILVVIAVPSFKLMYYRPGSPNRR